MSFAFKDKAENCVLGVLIRYEIIVLNKIYNCPSSIRSKTHVTLEGVGRQEHKPGSLGIVLKMTYKVLNSEATSEPGRYVQLNSIRPSTVAQTCLANNLLQQYTANKEPVKYISIPLVTVQPL